MFRRFKSIKLIKEILSQSSEFLTESDIQNAVELIEHNECSLAFELICQQLYEHNVDVSENLLMCISGAGKYMGVDEATWIFLDKRKPFTPSNIDKNADVQLVASEFQHLKLQGVSSRDAYEMAVRNGLGELVAIRMLRTVYGLTFTEATDVKDSFNL